MRWPVMACPVSSLHLLMSTRSACGTIQVWLGHESLATTQKYLEPSKETKKQLEAMKLPF
jgi:integrase